MRRQTCPKGKNRTKLEKKNLPDSEFKTLIIRMLSALGENFNKGTGNIKTKKTYTTSQK